MNIWDILILLLVAFAAVTALRAMRSKKQNGGCSCGCSGCKKECTIRQEENTETNR